MAVRPKAALGNTEKNCLKHFILFIMKAFIKSFWALSTKNIEKYKTSNYGNAYKFIFFCVSLHISFFVCLQLHASNSLSTRRLLKIFGSFRMSLKTNICLIIMEEYVYS